jgi:hypothetical protein
VIDLRGASLLDEAGRTVPVAGELLCFVDHVFTPAADRLAARIAAIAAAGSPCRVVSVDSAAALAAWRAGPGAGVAVGSDPDGALLRRIGRFDEAACAAYPGWAQVGRDGQVLAIGDDALPAAVAHFSEVPPAARSARAPASGATDPSAWLYPTLATVVVVAALLAWALSRGVPAAPASVPTSEASRAPAPAPSEEAPPEGVPAGGDPAAPVERNKPVATVGGGWYAVPPQLAGQEVRFVSGVLEVRGAPGSAPMACLAEEAALTSPVRLSGEWSLDGVGNKDSRGARVALRLLDASGHLVPADSVEGGAQRFVAQGRRSLGWTAFGDTVVPTPGVARVRVCVDNRAGSGVVRVRGVSLAAQ